MLATLLATTALLGTEALCRPPVCSCAGPGLVREARARGETIFEGTVLQVRDTTTGRMSRVVTLVVERVWGGSPGDTVQLLTGFGSGDCGYVFTEGERYLVFAYHYAGSLTTDICTHTTEAKKAAAIRKALAD